MISAIKLERHVTSTSILGIIVNKLYHKKKFYPIILFKVNKGLKIDLYYTTILPLSLTIRLRVEGGKESLLDA